MRMVVKVIVAMIVAMGFGPAAGQPWPDKPVRFIVPAPAGTAPDIVARLVAEKLLPLWGQQVIVDNRGGAGGIPGMSALARSAPDGYTFAVVQTAVITLTPLLFKDPQFNVETDITPIAMMGTAPLIIAVNSGIGVNTLADLVKLAKAQPGKVTFALPLLNSVPHLAGELLSVTAGMKLYAVPFNGSAQSIAATLSGETQMTIDGLAPIVPHTKAGKLKAIAVTSARRLPGYEDVPTVGETFPNFQANGWFGVFAPVKIPDAIAARVNADINTVLRMPDIVARFADLGVYPDPAPRKAVADFVKAERDRWAVAVRDLGVKPQ